MIKTKSKAEQIILLRYGFFLLFVFSFFSSFAQPYKNSWINYNQQYFKFPIIKDGIYRIDSLTLRNSGVPIQNINPKNFQLFGRGTEQYIYVQGENDGVFNNGDYIEFYAQRNDGFMDAEMYDSPQSQGNPFYSLFTDTAYYYLTWNSSFNNLRMATDTMTDFNNYAPAPFFFAKDLKYFARNYYYGETDYYGLTLPGYYAGEGWYSDPFTKGSSFSCWLKNKNVSSGANASLTTTVISASNDFGTTVDNRLTITFNNQTLKDTSFDGYKLLKFNFNVPVATLSSDSTKLEFESIDLGTVNPGRMAIGYAELKYPHGFNFANATTFKFYLPYSGTAKTRIDFTGFNNLSSAERLFDITNHRRIKVVANGSVKSALIIDSGTERECILTSDADITMIDNLLAVNSTGYFTNLPNLLNGTEFLIITHPSLKYAANQYAGYRSFSGLDALVANVEEVYEQFGYGVRKSPVGLRSFADYIADVFPGVEYVYYVGKSISSEQCRNSPLNFNNNLVPTWGYPASDVSITSGLSTGAPGLTPALATGRLAAENQTDVLIYLEKVQNYETNTLPGKFADDGEWMKTVLHFAGGTNINETQSFLNYVNVYRDTINAPYFGANVLTFQKSSTSPIQNSTSDSITTLINGGVSMMTFFGHAAGSSFDVDLGPPSDYANTNGKYPLIIGNSCFAGDIHQPTTTTISNSEQWILDGNGAIGFIAQVGAGFPYPLFVYTSELYNNISRKNYKAGIGKSIKNTIANIQNSGAFYISQTALEMTLHGDPAIVINSFDAPDLMVKNQNIYTTPSLVSTSLSNFELAVIVKNIGRATYDTVNVLIERFKPGESSPSASYIKRVTYDERVYFKDTVVFTIPIDPNTDGGINTFRITVDPFNRITPEIREVNNITSFDVNIISNEVFPVYPYKYAIVPKNKIKLKASTGNPFAANTNYYFEVDTNDTFVNPVLSGIVTSSGGVIEWDMNNYTLQDSVVYFWRIARQPLNGNPFVWRESSFQYIPLKSGWGQSHFHQFKEDQFTFLNYNKPNRRWDFSTNARLLSCRTYGNPALENQLLDTQYKIDNDIKEYSGCGFAPAVYVAVIDSLDLEPWGTRFGNDNPGHDFGNYNDNGGCRPRVEKIFMYRPGDTDGPAQMQGMLDMITNSVPNGYYILIYTYVNGHFDAWPQVLKDTLISWGASGLNGIQDNYPYIFFCRKGRNIAVESVASDATNGGNALTLTYSLFNNWDYGFVTSEMAGPASKWHSFHWRPYALENPSKDTVSVDIIGVQTNGSQTILISNLPADSLDILNLENRIDAGTYPFVKMKAYTQDSSRTPTQLKHWRLYYEGLPEAAVSPNISYSFYNPVMQEGDVMKFKVAVKNISDYNMDSLKIKYWVEDKNRNISSISFSNQGPLAAIRQDSLLSGDTLISTVYLNTYGLTGNNTLWMEVNPENDQPEQFHFNNYAFVQFMVDRDKENPLLDVTFDGVHILDGDIVSAKPQIEIDLKDENKYLAINDTGYFRISILDPDATVPRRIYFSANNNGNLNFVPAQLPDNRAKITYAPTFSKDGKYQLIVQANDASNNKSGGLDYKINFEVINKSMITEVMNYPNPFSTSTRFVFTLTGSEIPTTFKIQILTVTGKVVREIFMDELGPIHIGRNITEYAWDGRDEFGDRLANGIYLYRVYTKIGTEDIEKMNTAADQYFHKGFGKMYLMR